MLLCQLICVVAAESLSDIVHDLENIVFRLKEYSLQLDYDRHLGLPADDEFGESVSFAILFQHSSCFPAKCLFLFWRRRCPTATAVSIFFCKLLIEVAI